MTGVIKRFLAMKHALLALLSVLAICLFIGAYYQTGTYGSYHASVVAPTTATSVYTGSGGVYGYTIYNPNASVCYVEFFDSSTVTLGTTAPLLAIGIPASGGANMVSDNPLTAFQTNLQVAAVTAENGSTTCTTAPVVSIFRK